MLCCGGSGAEVTWFAQPRQWEGTPVVQRLINCAGGLVRRHPSPPALALLLCRSCHCCSCLFSSLLLLLQPSADWLGSGQVTDDDGVTEEVEPTPVLLFARNEGCGYVSPRQPFAPRHQESS